MGRTIATLCAAVVAVLVSGAARGDASPAARMLHPGDKLTYDLSLEIQIHVLPLPHSTQSPVTIENTVQGTETLTALRADPDGSVHSSLSIALQLKANGQSQTLRRNMLVKITPDQSISLEGGGDQSMEQYFSMISQGQRAYLGRTLHIGDVVNQTLNVPGSLPLSISTTARVVAEKTYQGYPTYAIQVTGSAPVDVPVMSSRMKGKLNLAGTTYVDQRDQLFVGSAMRANLDAQVSGPQGSHLVMAETTSLVLRSFTHGTAPTSVPSPSASAGPSAAPTQSPTPAPTPTSGYYTPPPPSPTPAPIRTPR